METSGFFYFKIGTQLSDLSGGGGGGGGGGGRRRRTILCNQMGVNWGNLTIAPTPSAAEGQSFIVLIQIVDRRKESNYEYLAIRAVLHVAKPKLEF